MLERLRERDRLQFFFLFAEERSARSGQDQAFEFLLFIHALQGLENGGMFAVDRQNVDPFGAGFFKHQFAARHQRFFVRQRDTAARLNGCQRRFQPRHAHDAVEHDGVPAERGAGFHAFTACEHLRRRIGDADFEVGRRLFVCQSGKPRLELPDLLLQPLNIAIRRQRQNFIAVKPCHVQRLHADGTGGAQYNQFFVLFLFTHRILSQRLSLTAR